MKREVRHIPVFLAPVLRLINPRPGMTVVDCTLGLGGHSAELLSRLAPTGLLIGIDFDPHHVELARAKLQQVGGNFELHQGNFAGITQILAGRQVDAILADLGVASPQIDNPQRGFSYKQEGPLDMRMDPTRGRSAAQVLADIPEAQLRDALLELGDETDAPQIARLIVQRRREHPITTTRQLMEIVCEARDFTVQRAFGAKLHPAARTFQALRILVNRELANLDNLLRVLPQCLKPGGIACVISFHSGEDRRVKDAFRTGVRDGVYSDISDDPITATMEEATENPRSRSAKLRWAKRAGDVVAAATST
jgi:16S rRNA (cytosine1402-N4)-methyltransferase